MNKPDLKKVVRQVVREQLRRKVPGYSEEQQEALERADEKLDQVAAGLADNFAQVITKKAMEFREKSPEEAEAFRYVTQGLLEKVIQKLEEKV